MRNKIVQKKEEFGFIILFYFIFIFKKMNYIFFCQISLFFLFFNLLFHFKVSFYHFLYLFIRLHLFF